MREVLSIIADGAHVLAFFAHHNRRAGILAGWEDTVGGDFCVFEQHQGDHAVVVRGFGVIEDRSYLFEM